jgi:hypothetical protein
MNAEPEREACEDRENGKVEECEDRKNGKVEKCGDRKNGNTKIERTGR